MKTETIYFTGDLINGDLKEFKTYEEAYKDYLELAESNIQQVIKETGLSEKQALKEGLNFHYVRKQETIYDKDNYVISDDSEILHGGKE